MRRVFTWNPNKNRANRQKHDGIDFETGLLVFDDVGCLITHDRFDADGFERLHAIGLAPNGAVLLVVFIEKGETENGEEITHILSARKAGHREIRRYFQQAAD